MSATSRHRITLAVAGFRALAERLRGSPWLVAATFGPPADEARIRAAERARGLPFPDDLRHLLAIWYMRAHRRRTRGAQATGVIHREAQLSCHAPPFRGYLC